MIESQLGAYYGKLVLGAREGNSRGVPPGLQHSLDSLLLAGTTCYVLPLSRHDI